MLLFAGALHAQVLHPDPGFVYDDTQVPRIDITIPPADLESLYMDPWSDVEFKAQFRMTREEVQEEVADVGIRCRGNTSREKQKKSFRISFNTFERGKEYHGMEEMNLNAETNDPSMVRSRLSWSLFRKLGIPAARSNHVLLYINGSFYGVYINTEHIDEHFMRSRFGNNDGNLYKCLWPADLAYKGDNPAVYMEEQGDRRTYDLRINAEWDDYGDLAALIGAIHEYSGSGFMAQVEKIMNVQQYLKIMAVDVMTANWDGYIGNKNNYYLYRDQVTGRFAYIPYDLDNTWGLDWLGVDWANASIYQGPGEERPLYDKIMEQERYRQQFTGYIKKLAAYMTSEEMEQEVYRWRDQISVWVSQDPFYSLDFGYEFSDFQNALGSGIQENWWLPYGVLEYASLRAASALEECIQADAPPLISHARVKPSNEMIRVDWSVEDDQAGFSTSIHYRINKENWKNLTPAGASITDPVSGVATYQYSLDGLEGEGVVDLYFTATDNAAQETRYPADFLAVSFPLTNGPVLINEFMASNSSSMMDEFGEYDDWVEIYNPTSARVWMGSLFLSDEMGDPGKYKFPYTYLNPKEFFLVWLDGQPEQGEQHAPFRISADGEKLRLSGRPAEGFPVLDSLSFGPQVTDVALGRSFDGGSSWMVFYQPTPGLSNGPNAVDETPGRADHLTLYPNPVTGGVLRFNRQVSGIICSANGQVVMELFETENAALDALAPGMYILRTDQGEALRFVVY